MLSEEATLHTPLQQWTLKNFKSVREQTIELGPLTLLVGANSSGKSSVLQSILMIAQAVQSQAAAGVFGLNGTLLDLGTIEDIRREKGGGGMWVGGRLESPSSHELSPFAELLGTKSRLTKRSGHRSLVDWQVELAKWGSSDSGAVAVRTVKLDAGSGLGTGEAYALQLHRTKSQPAPVTLWPEQYRPTRESDDHTAAFAGYSGTARRVRPRPVTEQLGAALFSGPFPVELSACKPLIYSVVEQWSQYVVRFAQSVLTQSARPLGEIFSENEPRAWWPADASSTFDELVTRLTESLQRHQDEASGQADWPLRLLDFSLLADKDPIDAVICALTAVELDDDVQGMAALDYLTSGSSNSQESTVREEDPWLQRGQAVRKIFREELSRLCTAVSKALGDDATALTEAGVQASLAVRYSADVADFFGKRVFYVGPLREDPHPVNRRSLVPGSRALGTKGEYTTAVLLDHSQDEVDVPWPGGDVLERRRATLRAAVEEWLRYFRVADELELKETPAGPSLGIRERPGGKLLSLTHVGVGISQLLPVIVLCLMAKEGSVIMLEQPELHLHPALQQRLGDFLLACASSGKQLIVETHSEYLVSRLRRHIAAATDDSLLSVVKILFVEKDPDSGVTTFNAVRTNEYGGIEQWPKGFFDQATSEAQEILRAAVKKRKAATEKVAAADQERENS